MAQLVPAEWCESGMVRSCMAGRAPEPKAEYASRCHRWPSAWHGRKQMGRDRYRRSWLEASRGDGLD